MSWISSFTEAKETRQPGKLERDKEGIIAALIAEVVFATLPLLLIIMIFLHAGRSTEVFASPEWSFGSAVLFGQTLAKLVSGLAKSGHTRPGAAALVTSLLIVFGLAPALIINAIMLQLKPQDLSNFWLEAIQVADFAAAAFVYVVIGGVAERRE